VELYQIRYFLALCETLNFARAAENCNVTQPTLTRAVQKLERELGGLLVRRERRFTHLTELGKMVRPMLKEVLSHSVHAVTAAKRHLSRDKEVLRLGITPSIGPAQIVPLLAQLTPEHRGVEFRLIEAPLPCLNRLMLGSELDAALLAYVGCTDKRLRYCRLYQERIVIVAPRGHRFEQCKAVPLRDLQAENFLFRTNCDMGDFLLEACRKQGFEPRIIYRGAREDWVQAMVASGVGVTIMPEFTHTGAVTIARPVVDPDLCRQLSFVTVAGRRQEGVLAALVRAIRAEQWHKHGMDGSGRSSLMFLSKTGKSLVRTT
jgi:DNA-binding transcriptional LysR family regulator